MKKARKRVTISVSGSLLADVDRSARELRESRSTVIEGWLRQGVEQRARERLDHEIESYYRTRSGKERSEDEAVARATARAASKLTFDEPKPRRSRKS